MSVLLLRVLCCFPFGRQDEGGNCKRFWVALPGAHLLAETSLNTVSNNFYQHHQVTVWLWAIFPPSMWQGCNGTSVCIWDIVIFCPRVWSHFMFQPESDFPPRLEVLLDRPERFPLMQLGRRSKGVKVKHTVALADQYEYLMLCVQEGVMNCSTGASDKAVQKAIYCVNLCQCCQHWSTYLPFFMWPVCIHLISHPKTSHSPALLL